MEKVYLKNTDRVLGIYIGKNPITLSHVIYVEEKNEYATYHEWQISFSPIKSNKKTDV
jgi:hypothetical protein